MRQRFLTLYSLFALLSLLAASPAVSEPRTALVLSSGPMPGRTPSFSQRVFPSDTGEIRAYVTLPGSEKKKCRFTWYAPDGRVFAQTYKILFTRNKQEGVPGWDAVNVSGTDARMLPGWWRVEADSGDEKLSGGFLLTKNRLLTVLDSGTTSEKSHYLKGMRPDSPDIKDTITLALDDALPEVRADAVLLLEGRREGWAVSALDRARDDPSPVVRAAAIGPLLALGGDKWAAAAGKAVSDPSPAVRAELARMLPGGDYRNACQLLGQLMKDGDDGVRMAALFALSGMEGEEALKAIAGGLSVGDKGFKKEVVGMLSRKKGQGRVSALAVALKDADPDIRYAALRPLISDGSPEARAAIGPLVDDPVEMIAQTAFEAVVAVRDPEGLALAVRSRYVSTRKTAVATLAAMHDGLAVKGLSAALDDKDPEMRNAALRGLKNSGAAGIPGLMKAMKDQDPDLRKEAAGALSMLGVGDAEEGMLAALDDPQATVRAEALRYFIGRGGPAMPGIIEKTACDPSIDIRMAGLDALAAVHGDVASRVISAYLECGDEALKERVVGILSGRDDPAAVAAMEDSLKDAGAGVRLKAASALLGLGVKAPLYALARDPDARLKRVALSAMRYGPEPGMLPDLAVLLKEKDAETRLQTLEVLNSITGEASSSVISSVVDDESMQVREYARAAVLERRDDGAVAGLAVMAREGDPGTRKAALDALGAIPGQRADEAMFDVFSSGDADSRMQVLKYLSGRDAGILRKAVAAAIADPDRKLRAEAMSSESRLPEKDLKEIYIASLSSEYPEVRESGLAGLRAMGSEPVEPLIKALSDPSPGVRRESLYSLTRLQAPELAEHLASLVNDDDPLIRMMVVDAARTVSDPGRKAAILVAAAGSADVNVAQAALEVLLPLGDPRALPLYEAKFRDNYRREDILAGIARVKGEAAIGSLSAVYRESSDEGLRMLALRSLAGRGPGGLVLLKEALSDPSANVRSEAVKAIVSIGGPDSVSVLGSALDNNDPDIKKQALDALDKTEGPAPARAMLKALNDPALRDKALSMLRARLGDRDTLESLAGYVEDIGDPVFRARTVSALVDEGLGEGWLVKFVDDKSAEVRIEAVRGLAGYKTPESAYGLFLAGADKEVDVKDLAARSLSGRDPGTLKDAVSLLFNRKRAEPDVLGFVAGNVRDGEALKGLVVKIQPDDTVRLRAALAPVMERHSPYDLPALAEGLKALDTGLKKDVVMAIGKVEGDAADKALVDLYKSSPALRPDVVRAAGEGSHAGAVLPLALKDTPELRREASLYFKGAGKDILSAGLSDTDETVRLAAAEAASVAADVGLLSVAASDVSAKVRMAAAKGLGDTLSEKAGEPLGALALDGDPGVSGKALASLVKLGDLAASSVWSRLAEDKGGRKPVALAALSVLTDRKYAGAARIFAGYYKSSDPEIKAGAEKGIRALGPGSLSALHPLLNDDKVRLDVLRLIGDIGDPSSEAPVLDVMPRLSGQERTEAVITIGRVGGPASLDTLETLYKEGGPAMKGEVIKALGAMRLKGDEAALAWMLTDALSSQDEAVRSCAADSAASSKAGAVRKALEARMPAETSPAVKDKMKRALKALWSEDRASVLASLSGGQADSPGRIRDALEDPDYSSRLYALKALGELPKGDAGPVYIAALSSAYPDVRRAGLTGLHGMKRTGANEAVEKLLADPVMDLRRDALSYLIEVHDPALPDCLPSVVMDADAGIAMTGVEEALKLANEKVRAGVLVVAAGSHFEGVAQAALEGLLPLGDARAVPVYERQFKSGYRRMDILNAAALVPGDAAIDTIAFAYRESTEDERLRLDAVTLLSGRGGRAIPVLKEALDDPSADVRRAVLKAAVKAGPDEGVPVFGKALGDKDPGIRLEAVGELGKAHSADAAPLLVKALGDEDFNVRYWAALALSGGDGPEAAYGLLLAGTDADDRVRAVAEKGLSGRDGNDLKGAVGLVFERGKASAGLVGFAARNINDGDALKALVEKIPSGDSVLLKAALGPMMERREVYDLPALAEGLKAGDQGLKVAAVRALAVIKSPDTGRALRDAYVKYPVLRRDIVDAAGEAGHASDVLPLAFKDGVDIRLEAAKYLKADLGVNADEILSAAMTDKDESVRMAAVEAASSAGNERILARASKDASPVIRRAAASGLGNAGTAEAAAPLESLAVDSDPGVAGEAVGSLVKLGDKTPSSVWSGLVSGKMSGKPARLAGLSELAKRKEPGSAALFAKALKDTSLELRKAGRDGLTALGAPALPVLHPLLADRDIRLAVLQVLNVTGDRSSEAPVLEALPGMGYQERVAAAGVLGRVGGPKSLDALAGLYKDGDSAMKGIVVKALDGMHLKGDEPGLKEVLSDALRSDDDTVRFYAAHAVGALKVAVLKGAVESAVQAERSQLVKDELARALVRLTSP